MWPECLRARFFAIVGLILVGSLVIACGDDAPGPGGMGGPKDVDVGKMEDAGDADLDGPSEDVEDVFDDAGDVDDRDGSSMDALDSAMDTVPEDSGPEDADIEHDGGEDILEMDSELPDGPGEDVSVDAGEDAADDIGRDAAPDVSDGGFTCAPPSSGGGICRPAVVCCVNNTSGVTCTYSSSCRVPKSLSTSGDWSCSSTNC